MHTRRFQNVDNLFSFLFVWLNVQNSYRYVMRKNIKTYKGMMIFETNYPVYRVSYIHKRLILMSRSVEDIYTARLSIQPNHKLSLLTINKNVC